jgi:hypothetical protein
MLASLFPRAHTRYTSLPVLGGSLEGLCVWLHARGYPRDAIGRRMGAAASLEHALRRRGVRSLGELTASALLSYAPPPRKFNAPPRGALVRSLKQYLEERCELTPTLPTATERRVADYRRYLDVRASAPDDQGAHRDDHQVPALPRPRLHPQQLHELRAADVEAFVTKAGGRVGRRRMGRSQGPCGPFAVPRRHWRGPAGLDAQVESPRIYRGERLPRHLRGRRSAFLRRSTARRQGRRDYAMFCSSPPTACARARSVLIDDVAWRSRQIRVPRQRSARPCSCRLPTRSGGASRLPAMRPAPPRHTAACFFASSSLSVRVWALGIAFHLGAAPGPPSRPRRSSLHSARSGPASAPQGASLKAIGDLLGHRSAESTGVYLRLDVDDLRDVALPPAPPCQKVRP